MIVNGTPAALSLMPASNPATDHWTHYFSEQPELLRYLNDVAARHEVTPNVRFDTEATGAVWDEDSATWRVAIRGADGREETLTARALICAVGQFTNSVIPDIKVRADVCDDYNRRAQERLKEMVYSHPAVSSYYKNAAGHVPTLYGFRIFDYWQWTNRPNAEDYELRHAPHEQE